MSDSEDKNLGMDRPIPRRDFINGLATGLVGMAASRAFGQSGTAVSTEEPAADLTGGDRSYRPR